MDGELYAEGVLNVYSFLVGIMVYLRRAGLDVMEVRL